ncbi:MAG: hypothetical protein KKB51_01630 [Candidatus Riflebacteria bacterium]|nr:hypothetical protein [Candidatus Riflebacteria bacterium]
MQKKLMFVFLALIVFLPFTSVSAVEQEIPNFEYRPATLGDIEAFIVEVESALNLQTEKLSEKYDGKKKKIENHQTVIAFNQVIADAKDLRNKVKANGSNEVLKRQFMQLQRLHYSVMADIGGAEQPNKILVGIKFAGNLGLGPIKLSIPNIICPDQKIGSRQAKLEAANLSKPGKKGSYSVDELAELTAYEVSRLEPPENHLAYTGEKVGNNFDKFLEETRELIRKIDKDYARFDYSYAKRVLFYDELQGEATSPKITTKDRYGLKWKLKWGDEVHTDVAMTRLYIDLGGLYTDLKFYSGPGETILILEKAGKKDAVVTFEDLATALLNSKFKFHAHRYLLPEPVLKDKTGRILGSGVVDEKMAEREAIPAEKIGCFYVLFKECQLSLFNPAIKRLGGAALSNVGAVEDRVARSSIVFNTWIKNKDMKDDNSRVGLIYNAKTGSFDRHAEFQSDLGCTLGGLRASGDLNKFEKSLVMLMPQSINFSMRPLYLPKAWKKCTWADARWMTMRIASFKREDFERIFGDSGWPVFMQRIAIEKLINRRNELVKAFKLEEDGFDKIECDPEFDFAVKVKSGTDQVVKHGKANAKSATVKKLVEEIHPEGLAEVIPRGKD